MMSDGSECGRERSRREAADWFARLRAPDGAGSHAAFEIWRTADPENAAAYDRLVRRWEQATLLRHTETGRARHLPERVPWRVFAPSRPAFASLAAGLALLLVIGVLVSRPVETSPTAYATRTGEMRTVHLSDGTEVTLDTASAVAPAFTSDERRVRLTRGRARFAVATATRPFVVETDEGEVTALGTVFDVNLRPGRMDVTLLRGVVEVRAVRAAGPRSASRVAAQLRPGQQLAVGTSIDVIPIPEPALPAQAGWVSGLLAYNDARLADVLADTNRYTRRKIRLADPALGDLRVTGAFRATPADRLAASLATAFGLTAEAAADGEIVLGPPS